MIKALEINTSIAVNLFFSNNTFLSCFFLLVLIIDLCFLIPAVNVQIFNPGAELVMLTEKPSYEANAEVETYPLTTEIKIRKCSSNLKRCKLFYAFQLLTH